jgi:hypothetical protein
MVAHHTMFGGFGDRPPRAIGTSVLAARPIAGAANCRGPAPCSVTYRTMPPLGTGAAPLQQDRAHQVAQEQVASLQLLDRHALVRLVSNGNVARAAHHGRNAGASCPPPTHRNGSRAVAAQKREDLGFHLRLTRSERRDARDDVERDQ